MTPEKQRIAIAEACGWTVRSDMSMYCNDKFGCADGTVPDYLNDLNAMHDAEKVLLKKSHDTRTKYYVHLQVLVTRATNCDSMHWSEIEVDFIFACIHATAVQRAKAFLCTLNLWKD